MALIAKLLHVALAMGLVGGLIGRTFALQRARGASDLDAVRQFADLAGAFDRALVIPCSSLVLVSGLATAWIQGWPILGFLVGGTANWVLASLVMFGVVAALVPTVFLPSGGTFDSALQEAAREGRITGDLRAALGNARVARAHRLEAALIAAIIVLMVLKPF
jgi:Predicted integral membrane protein (DUF2269)